MVKKGDAMQPKEIGSITQKSGQATLERLEDNWHASQGGEWHPALRERPGVSGPNRGS